MLDKMPNWIQCLGLPDAPIKYKWNNDVALKLSMAKDQNLKLFHAIDQASFKAKLSLGLLISECIFWRFASHVEVDDFRKRIEAAWAGVIDPSYTKSLQIELTDEDDFHNREPIRGPLEIAIFVLGGMTARYQLGMIYLAEPIVRQAMLARHILQNPKAFDVWLSDAIRIAVELFPRKTEYDMNTKKYDASGESPVPRELFDPGFKYTSEMGRMALQEFLKTLDHTRNPYLHSPEEMKAKGFKGTPYVI